MAKLLTNTAYVSNIFITVRLTVINIHILIRRIDKNGNIIHLLLTILYDILHLKQQMRRYTIYAKKG